MRDMIEEHAERVLRERRLLRGCEAAGGEFLLAALARKREHLEPWRSALRGRAVREIGTFEGKEDPREARGSGR